MSVRKNFLTFLTPYIINTLSCDISLCDFSRSAQQITAYGPIFHFHFFKHNIGVAGWFVRVLLQGCSDFFGDFFFLFFGNASSKFYINKWHIHTPFKQKLNNSKFIFKAAYLWWSYLLSYSVCQISLANFKVLDKISAEICNDKTA